MVRQGVTRRGVLRRSGAALGTAGLIGANGCLDRLQSPGGGGSNGYSRWIPEHGRSAREGDKLQFSFVNYEDALNYKGRLVNFDSNATDLNLRFDLASLQYGDSDTHLSLESYQIDVVTGEFEASTAVSSYFSDGYVRSETYRGYEILEHSDYDGVAGGVRDGVIVAGLSKGLVKSTIATGTGGERSYADANEDLGELVDRLGIATSLFGIAYDTPASRFEFDQLVAEGRSATLDGSSATLRSVFVFATEAAVTDRNVWDWALSYQDGSDVSVDTDGRVAVIESSADSVRAPRI